MAELAVAAVTLGTAATLARFATRWRSKAAQKHEETPDLGIVVLHPGHEPEVEVDICFIHGLKGNRYNALDVEEHGLKPDCWPREILGPLQGHYRVLSYGYSSYTPSAYYITQRTLYLHAHNFVAQLQSYREETKTTKRPIIFVAHSLGGVLLKNALVHSYTASQAYSKRKNLHKVASHTQGIVFYDPDSTISSFDSVKAAIKSVLEPKPDDDQMDKDIRVLETRTDMFKAIALKFPQYAGYTNGERKTDITITQQYKQIFEGFCKDAIRNAKSYHLHQQQPARTVFAEEENYKIEFRFPHAASPKFFDYAKNLSHLETLLDSREADQVNIKGMSGVGKTEIAIQYVRRNKHKFDSVLWLNASTLGEMVCSYIRIASRLFNTVDSNVGVTVAMSSETLDNNWPFSEQDFSVDDLPESFVAVIDSVIAWLLLSGNTSWLLVIDGIEADENLVKSFWRFIPPIGNGRGRIIVTGRTISGQLGILKRGWKDEARVKEIEIQKASSEDLKALFLANLDEETRAVMETDTPWLVQSVDAGSRYNVVDIVLAARRLESTDCNTSLSMNFRMVEWGESWDVEMIMGIVCELSLSVIPIELLLFAQRGSRNAMGFTDPEKEFHQVIHTVVRYMAHTGRILLDEDGGTLRVGQATRESYREWRDEGLPRSRHANHLHIALGLLSDALKVLSTRQAPRQLAKDRLSNEDVLRLEQMLLPHVLETMKSKAALSLDKYELFVGICKRHGRYSEAMDFTNRKLAAVDRIDRVPTVLQGVTLARLLNDNSQGMLEELDEIQYPLGQRDRLQLQLEHLLSDFKGENWDSAIERLRPVMNQMETSETRFSRTFFSHFACLRIFADCLKNLGRDTEAESVLGRILMELDNTVGLDHPLTRQTIRSLGRVCERLGNHDQAYRLFTLLLRRTKELLGEFHPATLKVLSEVALILSLQGKQDLATGIFELALKNAEETLGSWHPIVLEMQEQRGLSFWSAGDRFEAVKEYRKILDKKSRSEFYTKESIEGTKLRLMSMS